MEIIAHVKTVLHQMYGVKAHEYVNKHLKERQKHLFLFLVYYTNLLVKNVRIKMLCSISLKGTNKECLLFDKIKTVCVLMLPCDY